MGISRRQHQRNILDLESWILYYPQTRTTNNTSKPDFRRSAAHCPVAIMKLTFKDLKQQKFVIEAEPSELISDVKEKIAKEKGWETSNQKLIYSGKILQDAHTVESYNIEEKGFIVCMVSKPKAAPASAASSSKAPPSTPAPPVAASTPAPPQAPAQSTSSTPAIPATPSPAGSGAAPAAFRQHQAEPHLVSRWVLSVPRKSPRWRAWVSRDHKSMLLCVPPSTIQSVLLSIS